MHNNAFHISQGLTLFRLISWVSRNALTCCYQNFHCIVCTTLCLFYSAFPKFVMHKAFRILDSNHFALPVFHNILLILEANSELFICRLWNWWHKVGVVCIWRKAIESSNIPFGILMICSALFTRCTCAPKKFLMLVALIECTIYKKCDIERWLCGPGLKALAEIKFLPNFTADKSPNGFTFLFQIHT